MACIAVLDHNQQENERARRFVKRSEGQSLVRRALAYWVIKNAVARMLPIRAGAPASPALPPRTSTYIPDTLPPSEVHGCTFDDPLPRSPGTLVFTRLWAERQEWTP